MLTDKERDALVEKVGFIRHFAEWPVTPMQAEEIRDAADDVLSLLDRLTTTTPSAPRQEEALRNALAANERDRSSVTQFINRLQSVMDRWSWVREGRGSYEWDDDEYRKEFGRCMNAIQRCINYWTKATHAHDWSDCPTTQAEVIAARDSHRETAARAQDAFAPREEERE